MYTKGYRTPQTANLYGEPTGIVLFPVSLPKSDYYTIGEGSRHDIFESWEATIDSAADNDEMVLFLFRSQEIGDPLYTDNFTQLFSYARDRGSDLYHPRPSCQSLQADCSISAIPALWMEIRQS